MSTYADFWNCKLFVYLDLISNFFVPTSVRSDDLSIWFLTVLFYPNYLHYLITIMVDNLDRNIASFGFGKRTRDRRI